MADWFKFYENGIYESRFQWALHEESGVCPVWLWILSECCKHKSDHFGWKDKDFELFGVSHVINLTVPKVNQSINLLVQIGYIEKSGEFIKVLQWNKFQSDYMRKKDHRESVQCPDSVQTKTEKVVLEERRVEEKRVDKKEGILSDTAKVSSSIKRQLTDMWCSSWQKFHGSPYSFDGAKDGKAADKLLKIEADPINLMTIAEKAWKLNGKHEFERGMAIQLSSFASQFNRIRLAVGVLSKPEPKGPYYHEEGK